jgi:hypothetical protein
MICQFVWPQGLRGSIRCHRSGCFVEDGPAVSGALHRAKKSTSLGMMEISEVDSSASQFRPLGHGKNSILDAEDVEVGKFQV